VGDTSLTGGCKVELIGLCLTDSTNQYQQALRAEAEAAAAAAGLGLQSYFCEGDYAKQIVRLGEWLENGQRRPAALVIMAVRDRGLDGLVRRAAAAGVHVLFLNQTEDPLDEVRRGFPAVVVSQVCVDEEETGHIQGRLVRALLPAGGRVLLVQGTGRSVTARGRTAGLLEILQGQAFEIDRLEAGWSEDEGAAAVGRWLGIALKCGRRLDLVVCHNDSLAVGACRAIDAAAASLGLSRLRDIPVVGCDGTPDVGQAMVREGTMAATVVLPRLAGAAVEAIARLLRNGHRPPPVLLLRGAAHPESLSRIPEAALVP
jgi:ABC-type sugar transport system substrate-binding protein